MSQEPVRHEGGKPEPEEDFEASNMTTILLVAGAGLVLCMLSFAFFWWVAGILILGSIGYLVYRKVR